MKQFLCGLAMLPLLSSVALAQPAMLSEGQMDAVSGGWSLYELDCSNTSTTMVSVYGGHDDVAPVYSGTPYLYIQSAAITISSSFGPCCSKPN
jgi:hypothetical protein